MAQGPQSLKALALARGITFGSATATYELQDAGFAPLLVSLGCQGFANANSNAGALSRHAQHAGSASALMGTFQFSLGASSGLLVSLLTDGTPRGMAAMMFCGMLGAVIADRFRPNPELRPASP